MVLALTEEENLENAVLLHVLYVIPVVAWLAGNKWYRDRSDTAVDRYGKKETSPKHSLKVIEKARSPPMVIKLPVPHNREKAQTHKEIDTIVKINMDTTVNYHVLLKVNQVVSVGEEERVGEPHVRGDAVHVFAISHVQANRSFDKRLKIEFPSDLEHT
ncbi:hypothetical protein OIU77_017898 [Salix suchowensis]|uniref:Uncharacterized protein n=1 Tax=Salix suchowensis TaxID=1278906 RepID=A0ABQ8ZQB9_9ROSI|nr:hypothetical protein OIU77_017898 [Salix suchowensis]